jgi:tetratricopeptide (TPR) repeat protein
VRSDNALLDNFQFQRYATAALRTHIAIAAATTFQDRGNHKAAVRLLTRAIEGRPRETPAIDLANIYVRRAFSQAKLQQYSAALADLDVAGRLDSTWSVPPLDRAHVFLKLRRPGSAINELNVAKQRAPAREVAVALGFAAAYNQLNDSASARAAMESARASLTTNSDAFDRYAVSVNTALLLLRSGAAREALAELTTTDTAGISASGRNSFLLLRGEALAASGDSSSALRVLESVSDDDQNAKFHALLLRAAILRRMDRRREARQVLHQIPRYLSGPNARTMRTVLDSDPLLDSLFTQALAGGKSEMLGATAFDLLTFFFTPDGRTLHQQITYTSHGSATVP